MRQCDNARLKVIINHGLQTKLRNYLIKEISLRNKLLDLDLQHMMLLIKGIRIMLINKLIKITKEDYFKTKLGNAKNSYDSWQAINSLLNKRSKTTEIPELQIENRSVKGDENIASCFNDYFSTVGSKLASNVTGIDSDPLRFVPPVTNTFYFQNISVLELPKTIAQIKINKTLYGALTRWGYTNTHITVHDTRYSTQLFQLRSKPGPKLSGKVEYERESLTH